MARPKNDKLKTQIAEAAAHQFREKGYAATSYTSIAQECGISRNLAQYHFPKKELLAITFMEGLLADRQNKLGYSDADLMTDYERIYEVGCAFFEYLLGQGYRQFLLDIISSREMTENVLDFNERWVLARIDISLEKGRELNPVTASVIVSMGGFYELLYHCLRNDVEFDVRTHLAVVMRSFVAALGVPADEAAKMFG